MINQEGPGWRLAKDSSKKIFPYLIGGENWAVELSEKEWNVLVTIIFDLIDQHDKLRDQLMPEEMISLEIERPPCWAMLDGKKDLWNLKVILNGNGFTTRSVEFFWPTPCSQLFASAIRIMWDSK